jgi:hypothetical protein
LAQAFWLTPASAMEIKCIEASRYKHLYRIFGGDAQKLAAYLDIDTRKYGLPAPELCRAALLSGGVEPLNDKPTDDVGIVLSFIIQNRGWLSTIYLDSGGGNTGTGWHIAMVLRSFRLKTRVSKTYSPDFGLPPLRLPREASPPAPKIEGAKCWLKDDVPNRSERKGYVSGVVRATATESTTEPDYYRDGSHYRELDLAQADPTLCQQTCIKEARCVGWNYRKPEGRTDDRPHCWLLERTGGRVRDGLMVSGMVTRPGGSSFEEDSDRYGRDLRQLDLPSSDAKLCQRQCVDEPRCRSWAFKPAPVSDLLSTMSDWEGYRRLQQSQPGRPGEEGDWCASSCSGIFIGGVDRIGRVLVHRPNTGFGETQYGNDDRSFEAFYSYMDPGPQFARIMLWTSGQSITRAPVARLPRYNIDYAIANCPADPEVLQNVEGGLELAISKLRSTSLAVPIRVEHLQNGLRATHDQRRAVEQCLARALERDRLVAFAEHCGKGCDAKKVREKLAAELKWVTEHK